MNSEKAREFFSAYYEGSLDAGLVLALEQKFKTDSGLRYDYDAFASAFAELNTLRDEEIEIPVFLSDRIATRVEEARQQQRKPFVLWNLPWLRIAPYALASVAILGAVIGIASKGPVTQAGLFGSVFGAKNEIDPPTFKFDGSNVLLGYQPRGNHTVVISSGTTGNVIRTLNLEDSVAIEPKLNNDNAGAEIFSIREDTATAQVVAVPGKVLDTSHPSGEGTLGQFALAIADYYHVPLLLENIPKDKLDAKIKWTLDGIDAGKAANANLEQIHLSADLRADGMLSINGS
jgi:hypothetical protein